MIKEVTSTILVFAMLTFSYVIIYQNFPMGAVEMEEIEEISEPVEIIDYGTPPVSSEKLRFNHNNISYFIESSCSNIRASAMRKAFKIFQNQMGIISFYEFINKEADILVGCSEDFIELGEDLFIAGEGGPMEIMNTTNFQIIQKGKIWIYKDPSCEQPVIELHELSHVFGFDHSLDPKNIMYNTSDCNQKISKNMKGYIQKLYSIKPLPDAKIYELVAIKKGRYLDFNISVSNEGLTEIENLGITLIAGEKEIETIYIDYIGLGYINTIQATNVRLPSTNIKTIDFILDYESQIEELNEENNARKMTISIP